MGGEVFRPPIVVSPCCDYHPQHERSIRVKRLFLILAFLLLGGAHLALARPAAAQAPTCQFFTETGGGQGGFSVCDDAQARFLSAFNSYGLQRVGYPISRRYERDGFVTQAFQKAIFQWRADTGTVAFVNIFDDLHNAGFDQRLLETRQTPFQLPASWDTPGATFEQVMQRRQGLLNARPAMRTAYFSVSNPLLFFGLPTSEVTDMGNHYAIRLQRTVLQEWKEDVPWARAGQVTIANGGDIAKELGGLPATALRPETSATPPPPGSDYEVVQDDSGTLLVSLPASWEVGTGDGVILASADLDAWDASFGGTSEGAATVSGIFMQLETDEAQPVTMGSVEEFLDGVGVPSNCEYDPDARTSYDDGVYQGLSDPLTCDVGTYYQLVAFDPDDPTFLIWIEGYVITEQDAEIYQTVLDTFVVTSSTNPPTQPQTTQPPSQGCDPSYPTICIPPGAPDIDCSDIPDRNFPILPPDPHDLDGNDRDGIGCETP